MGPERKSKFKSDRLLGGAGRLFRGMDIMKFFPPRSLSLLLAALYVCRVSAQQAPLSFNHDIRPLLANNCFQCHGPDEAERKGGTKQSGGLRLDTQEGAFMDHGGKRAIAPGHPEQSEMLARLTSHDPDELMPPAKSGKKLAAAEIQKISDWIKSGAKYAQHWSYEKPVRHPLPKGAAHPVDAFLLDRLSREGLSPQPEADRATLVRRVTLDLTGLPATPEDVDAFLNDTAPGAWERVVDRLLDSPAYGEHWARLWLDLARYADSAGYADDPQRTIWGYRDYVIRAFNENKPFDRFTIEQIAGDLLPEAGEDQITATAFHRNTMTNNEGGTNDEEFRTVAIVDRVNTTLALWMGTSMACAQCHTHKYDPITQHEYFQVYAFLNSTEDADRRNEEPLYSFFSPEQKKQRAKLERELAALEEALANTSPEVKVAAAGWADRPPDPGAWQPLIPAAVKSQASLATGTEADGTVAVAAPAEKDTLTVDIPLTAARKLGALRLEALPHASLPSGGPGYGGGNFVITGVSATLTPPEGAKGPAARYVRIELPGHDKVLQLAEVQVFSGGANLAIQGTATQISTRTDAVASRAIDGNTDPKLANGSVAHTAGDSPDPWWEVDLKSEHPVDRIVVFNREEAAERLAGFRVIALDEQRRRVWEKSDNPAAPETSFVLSGPRGILFSDATAEYEQDGFTADSVIPLPAARKEGRHNQGWAVGGAQGKPHALTLIASAPVEIPAGSRLTVTIAQQSRHANHTLGRFRLSATSDSDAVQRAALPRHIRAILSIPDKSRSPARQEELVRFIGREVTPDLKPVREKIAALRKELDGVKPSTVPVMRELPPDKRRKTQVQLRGNWLSLGDVVTEGVPAAFHPLPADAPKNRLTLARWLVSEENPLTARVIANRFWEAVFGIGLVRTSEEFGSQGEQPSHPELLDWLATELVREKWDLKKFLRLLVTSAAYRQSSKVAPGMAERDPDNRLLARGPRVRLSAEMIRDQALAVSGLLSRKMHGPSVRPERPNMGLSAAFGGGLDWKTSGGEDRLRRALYTEWRRTSPYPSMTTFDAPNREVCTIRRNQTNTPLQALVTLNDPVYVEAAQAFARRLFAASKEPRQIIREAFRLALSRAPSDRELERLLTLQTEAAAEFRKDPQKAADMAANPIGPVPAGTDPAELAAWTAVANVVLNLDELLMKR